MISALRPFLTLTFAAAVLAVAPPPAQAAHPDKVQTYSLSQAEARLKALGMDDIEQINDNAVRFEREGSPFLLYRFDDGDLQLYYGVTGVTADLELINAWNRDHRLSRAYVDAEGDYVLESDLLADEGVTQDQLDHFIEVFFMLKAEFVDHID